MITAKTFDPILNLNRFNLNFLSWPTKGFLIVCKYDSHDSTTNLLNSNKGNLFNGKDLIANLTLWWNRTNIYRRMQVILVIFHSMFSKKINRVVNVHEHFVKDEYFPNFQCNLIEEQKVNWGWDWKQTHND